MRKATTEKVEKTISVCDICQDDSPASKQCEMCGKDLCYTHTCYYSEHEEDDYPLILCSLCLERGRNIIEAIKQIKIDAVNKENALWLQWRDQCRN